MDPIKVDELQYLTIGVQGENVSLEVKIDVSEWVAQYPGADLAILFKPYNSSTVTPVLTSYSDGILTWSPDAGATAVVGIGYTEVRAYDNTTHMVKKSRVIPTSVDASVSGVEGSTAPTPYQSWVQDVLGYKTDAASSATSASTSAGNSEAWAVGQRGGVDVGDSDPTYHNNAKYYAGKADDAVEWIEEHLTTPDTTLAVSGVAADSKSVGDALALKANDSAVVKNDDSYMYGELSRGRVVSGGASKGDGSIAFGNAVEAAGDYSQAYGSNTNANHKAQHVFGEYNTPDGSSADATARGNYIEIVGNGTGAGAKSNARTLDWDGNERVKGDVYVGCNADSTGGSKLAKVSELPDVTGKADKSDTVLSTTLSRGRYESSTEGDGSLAFGNNVIASGDYSQAFGDGSIASGDNAHAEGGSTASGNNSHAEGYVNVASGANSHAEGASAVASGSEAHAEGDGTIANHKAQHAFGQYNVSDGSSEQATERGNYIELVGNGTLLGGRSNARALDWNGNEYLKGDLYIGCGANSTGGSKVAKDSDVSSKADKVSDPTSGDLAALDSNGNLTDSGYKASDFVSYPSDPSSDGNYVLKNTISGGSSTKAWSSEPSATPVVTSAELETICV